MVLLTNQDHGTQILLTLFLMLFAAKAMAEIFQRLRQPAVVGDTGRHHHWSQLAATGHSQ